MKTLLHNVACSFTAELQASQATILGSKQHFNAIWEFLLHIQRSFLPHFNGQNGSANETEVLKRQNNVFTSATLTLKWIQTFPIS